MVPNSFFARFAVYGDKGLDSKKTSAAIMKAVEEWAQEQSDIKPAILEELREFGQLGETKLTNFVIHRLKLRPNKDALDRIASALEELKRANRIRFVTTSGGRSRGRGTGYVLVEQGTQERPARTSAA